ncbi:MAG: hypothetical protein B6245_02785 [Desulfobacteraceae bacterium 4572_88]|nr:MAG: hypothetical protein B6245_02785 [Desulfobacteraceae bacterium 4572_88]
MEQREMQEFSFSDIQIHPNIITDILERGEDIAFTLRREGDRVTVYSHQTCGDGETGQMTLEDVMKRTISLFRHFAENADSIMSELKPGWDAGLLEVMNRLTKRVDAIEHEPDLLAVANVMHDLSIEIPHFPPDDNPPEHFRPEDLMSSPDAEDYRMRVEHHRAVLKEAFRPCFERIEQAWKNLPSIIPVTASKGAEETPWHMMGMFRDGPTWGEMFDDIERERNNDLIWTGGEAE